MIKNMTVGQHYPAESHIHRLDPRIKLLGVLVYITLLLMVDSVWGYIVAGVSLTLMIYASRVPVRYMLRGLRAIIFIVVFTAVLNIFFTPGQNVIFEKWIFRVTWEGLAVAGVMGIRLTMLVIGSSILTLTTSPLQLSDAIEYLLKPLKKIGVPAHEIAMMMTIALRYIPTLMEEMDKIMKAQMARGADFDTGGIIKKAKSLIPLLVPLFISSFRRADELAVAMEARCYHGDINRTKMKRLKLVTWDYTALIWIAVYTAVQVTLRVL